jgi:hypothetical protein
MGLFSKGVKPKEETYIQTPEEPEVETPTEEPEALSPDKVQAMINEALVQQMQTLGQYVQQPGQSQTEQPTTPQVQLPDEVPDEAIFEAAEDGDFKKMLALQKQQRERQNAIHQAELQQLRSEGLSEINKIGGRIVQEKLPDYAKYKDEIDDVLRQVAPEQRGNMEFVEHAYNMVRGRHVEDIVAEKVEEELRKRNLASTPDLGTETGRTVKGGNKLPTTEEQYGIEAVSALEQIGKDEAALAKQLGYKSLEEYRAMDEVYRGPNSTKKMHKW